MIVIVVVKLMRFHVPMRTILLLLWQSMTKHLPPATVSRDPLLP